MKIKQVLDSINTRSLRRLLIGPYHRKGPRRKPCNPLSMLKAKLLKHLLHIPSDRRQLEQGAVKGEVVAVDSSHVKTYSQRSLDNRTGRSDPNGRVGRGKRGFILGYKVHTACYAESEMSLAVAPCNMNDKTYFKPLLERIHGLGIRFKAVLADAQYSSKKVGEAVEVYGMEPVIPVRKDSRGKEALLVGKDFRFRGARRLVELFKKRWSVECSSAMRRSG